MLAFLCIVLFILTFSQSVSSECPPVLTDCDRNGVSFFLYTGATGEPEELQVDDPKTIENAKINPNTNFKFIIHGYKQSKDLPVIKQLRDEYFKQNSWNIIQADYAKLAADGCYSKSAVPSAPKIGECTGKLVDLLIQRNDVKIEQFHFIGYSLGAQICAQVSTHLPSKSIPRITGCAPALPGFQINNPNAIHFTLSKDCAKFVDVIHTDVGKNGVVFSSAHYDIYAGNGILQKGCENAEDKYVCSHLRALEIFIESINSPVKFIAVKCDSLMELINNSQCTGNRGIQIEVGEHCSPPKYDESEGQIGIYQFDINDKPPYALGQPNQNTGILGSIVSTVTLIWKKVSEFVWNIFNFSFF